MIRVSVKHDVEGPAHDPYEYTDITVERGARSVVFHTGFVTTLKRCENKRVFDMHEYTLAPHHAINDAVLEWLGFSLTQALRWNRKAHEAKLRAHRAHGGSKWVRGMPGESMEVCACGEVLDFTFNEAEIM